MSKLQLYPYQEIVGKQILSGKSVILQAPTGAGKTTAALLPFLHARKYLPPNGFPRKCIYSVPMRILANQFHEEYRKIIRQYGWKDDLSVTIQTGDQPDDPKFEGDLIFTTIDQTLSNFLNIPYALGIGSANLNAGAIVSSYIVFDELHLFDPGTMLPTTLEMLLMLRKITPFVMMTATFSSEMLDRLAHLLDAVVVPDSPQVRQGMEQIGSQAGKVRRLYTIDAALTADRVLNSKCNAKRTICICNTVSAAQNLYRSITQALTARNDQETQVCLLHSRFYKEHRNKKEAWAREQFGLSQADYNGPPLILIATQVIEVGLDVTCDVMHTELAPAASILQRVGRCARRAHETGDVFIYLPRSEEGEPDYTPYFLKSQPIRTERGRRLCEATWIALSSSDFQGAHMSFSREQELINRVHTPIDNEILDTIADSRHIRQSEVLNTIQGQDRGMASELIRNIDTRFVVIHPNPGDDDKLRRNPWYYDGFSLYPGSLAKAYNVFEKAIASDIPGIMQWAYRVEDKSDKQGEEAPSRQPPEYRWVTVKKSDEVFQSAILAVHPSIVRYDERIGFEFGLSNDLPELRKRPGKRGTPSYGYHRETYAEHIAGLYRAYRYSLPNQETGGLYLALADEIAYTAKRMEKEVTFGLPAGLIDTVLRALFVCHDLGKLDVKWQAWAYKWQERVGTFYGGIDMRLPLNYMAAHTDYNPTDEQKAAQKKLGKRPPHAGESAMAGAGLLSILCGKNEALWRAAMTAIARHHHAGTNSYQPFAMHKAAKTAVLETLRVIGLPIELADEILWRLDNSEELSQYLVKFTSTREVLLYLLFIRVLRLADQRSQQK